MGDAFGAPFEGGLPERGLWCLLGRTRDGKKRFTDDTQMSIDLMESLLACNGLNADDAAKRFAQSYRWDRGYGPGAARILKRIARGMPWEQARVSVYPQGSFGNGGAMRAPAMALYSWLEHPGDLERVQQLVRQQAAITHAHVLAQDGAALIAVAVIQALSVDANTWNATRWMNQVRGHVQLHDAQAWAPRLNAATEWLAQNKQPAASEIARTLGNGITATDSCVTAVYIAARCMHEDFENLLKLARQCGGDVDTISCMAAAIFGAARGTSAIPADMLRQLEQAERIVSLASQLSAT